jgi:hypothetical protein
VAGLSAVAEALELVVVLESALVEAAAAELEQMLVVDVVV